MSAIGAGIPAGARVAQVTGLGNVNLDIAATASASGVAVRFSMFDDARVAGSPGGEQSHRQTLDEMATHQHSLPTTVNFTAGGVGGLGTTGSANASGFAGGGVPSNLLTPSRVGTWYIKK